MCSEGGEEGGVGRRKRRISFSEGSFDKKSDGGGSCGGFTPGGPVARDRQAVHETIVLLSQ